MNDEDKLLDDRLWDFLRVRGRLSGRVRIDRREIGRTLFSRWGTAYTCRQIDLALQRLHSRGRIRLEPGVVWLNARRP